MEIKVTKQTLFSAFQSVQEAIADDKAYTLTLKEFKKKRSLDANAYFWVLCDKLAEKLRTPKETIYREAIKNIGGNCEVICVQNSAVNKLCDGWQHNGLGWLTDTIESKIEGCTNVILYYGSSTYDSKQMARLIDNIVQDCNQVGIDTLTPSEIESLLGRWRE